MRVHSPEGCEMTNDTKTTIGTVLITMIVIVMVGFACYLTVPDRVVLHNTFTVDCKPQMHWIMKDNTPHRVYVCGRMSEEQGNMQ